MKVLLIDDSTTMRKIQRRALSTLGIEDVDEAANGREGVDKLQAENYGYNMVLLDMNMPEMGGMEVLKTVRADPKSNNIPIIMCTSVADKEQVMEAIKSGASNYVVKPFTPEDLQKKISKYLK
ncbi:MAG: response regulator [Lentisphaeraceae bacterium]|nr:response regulator [Lentisphaeraceae bacterium]